jgi:Uma2 family endonuclease
MSQAHPWGIADYERAAAEYLSRLPLEHFMEGIPQATQREITLASLAQLKNHEHELQVFNELLVQYFYRGNLRQVVPDNMVRRSSAPCLSPTCFIADKEPAGPLWVLEYVSHGAANKRKDYEDSFRKYERELKVPYCLLFDPEIQDLFLYRHNGERYTPVEENAAGRLPLPELELEIGLHENWVRFWHRGQLLELPRKLRDRVEALEAELDRERQRAEQERQRAEQERQRAEQEQERAEEQTRRAEQAQQQAAAEKQRAEEQAQQADQARQSADREKQRAEQERQRAADEKQRADQEQQQRTAAEAEVARLQALLEQLQQPKTGLP